jgi:hypothetical protein
MFLLTSYWIYWEVISATGMHDSCIQWLEWLKAANGTQRTSGMQLLTGQ